MRGVCVVIALASGCGRIAFDPQGQATGTSDGGDTSSIPDATTACVDDGFCAPECAGTDPDCAAVCGDAVCAGNAGELCTNCPADCRTTTDVCGNGACGPTETSASCYTDCGPTPWPWPQDEADLLVAVNQARTQGTACDGGPVTTAPAVTLDADLVRAARDVAWEQAHLAVLGPTRCNGQSFFAYMAAVNANGSRVSVSGASTTQQRISEWIASNTCSTLMNPSFTLIGIGIAEDMAIGYVALLR